jgi:hypothetical protein
MPWKWWAAIRIGRRKPGAELSRLPFTRLRPTTAQRDDVIDWSHEVRRQVDADHLGKVARANACEPHRAFYVASPRDR